MNREWCVCVGPHPTETRDPLFVDQSHWRRATPSNYADPSRWTKKTAASQTQSWSVAIHWQRTKKPNRTWTRGDNLRKRGGGMWWNWKGKQDRRSTGQSRDVTRSAAPRISTKWTGWTTDRGRPRRRARRRGGQVPQISVLLGLQLSSFSGRTALLNRISPTDFVGFR